jgi:bifunctional non-homologous end joining protein LigD
VPNQESEEALQAALRRGRLSLVLEGEKLRGGFSLFRAGDDEKTWLLVKKADEFAETREITDENRSVLSYRTLEDVQAGRRLSDRASVAPRPVSAPALSGGVRPMLATLAPKPFDHPDWLFEIKWDGYRAIAEVGASGIRLYSRTQQPFNDRYPAVVEALQALDHEAVLDGEVVVLDDHGKADFQSLQNYPGTGQGHLVYYVFDILSLDGRNLRSLPLTDRKKILKDVLRDSAHLKLSDAVRARGTKFLEAAAQQGLEGIMAKHAKSPYREGLRSEEWLKIKVQNRQEAVICGFTDPQGSRKHFGALVLGLYQDGDLIYIGHTGSGFDQRTLADLHARLAPLVRTRPPFQKTPKTNARVHWVEPRLVCEVKFEGWTRDGLMRIPIFVGLREDKPADDVHRETPKTAKFSPEPPRRAQDAETVINGHPVKLTRLHKVFWPKEGYTKGDLIAYYRRMAPYILPYLKDRPLSLHRHPDGIEGESFYQKNFDQRLPEWIKTINIHSESEDQDLRTLVCQDEATLAFLANLGCIEINPWNSRIRQLDRPDYFVVDLDPEDIAFEKVVETAWMVREVLDQAGAESYCKTSGSRGLHIFVPLGARYTYDQARFFAEIIVHLVHQELPLITSLERSPLRRQRRVYLDFLQNRRGQTLAAAYSVRPRLGATVSTPLRWEEVTADLDPTAFTIRTLEKRLRSVGDLWEPILGPGIDLEACLNRIEPNRRN